MKELFLEMFRGLLLGMCFVLFCFVIATLSRSVYAVDLSKSKSVTPQRHCGFIVPKFCKASQAAQKTSASVTATHTRLQSLYEGMTRQNKSSMANMSGGTFTPRVNPLTLISQISVNLNSKVKGGNHHA
ncbi:hypothetical protein KAM398_09120 [Acinetobacter sp. KAM398]|nr:hypothetical protein KAM392_07580 [Acinetobacter sp. KAM392]GJC33588.1 hypothetical protein KAM393_07570 [Acinetobacter sp. KAM393]GJC36417.1 hypothetical protein KAM394_07570 [Acinetobacter sp. KAM394]GJC39236.1 hypothetical protein KAM395_07570 [Acinetobacter sp. KAM395]GJC42335.1 hypothetical protein KAM396_10320 [Acinetobacter sp. KAM396]GJC44918.1 hypothetical protein KAM397_07980 [Acinetobacter sp. KAM397]GJC47860.1 hypothetical protein KAM398_09120 [Acinetobacter sp. KAM398]GJC5082